MGKEEKSTRVRDIAPQKPHPKTQTPPHPNPNPKTQTPKTQTPPHPNPKPKHPTPTQTPKPQTQTPKPPQPKTQNNPNNPTKAPNASFAVLAFFFSSCSNNSPPRAHKTQFPLKQTKNMSTPRHILVLSSSELPPVENEAFALHDPPPTQMTLTVDTRFMDLSVQAFNNTLHVYLHRYVLDCVWRDAQDPRETMTSSAGTSISKRIKVYLYAGNPNITPRRLLDTPIFRENGTQDDPDFYIYRDQTYVFEKAHNPYHPNLDLSSDLYFENQYTQQAESYGEPGLYLGKLHPQAILALRATSTITVQWTTDRTDFPSPFWHNRFLVGASLWNPATHTFEVHPPGQTYRDNHFRLGHISLQHPGGPYFPLSLYTLAQPLRPTVAPFLNSPTSTLTHVTDPVDGQVFPLNDPLATLHLSQIGLVGSTDLTTLPTNRLPRLAPSDERAFRVPVYNATTQTTSLLPIHDPIADPTAFPPRYALTTPATPATPTTPGTPDTTTCSLHYPNGAWKGRALPSVPVPDTGTPGAPGTPGTPGTPGAPGTPDTRWHSPFPWEHRLPPAVLDIVNDHTLYDATQHALHIVDVRQYLFMDPGTPWNGHSPDTTLGERSLQFDFGKGQPRYINQCQLLFPRSQENHQPYRLQASMQKRYNNSADAIITNLPRAFWFGGLQMDAPTGSANDPRPYTYLNTHTQQTSGLQGSYTSLYDVPPRLRTQAQDLRQSETPPVFTQARGRHHVVTLPDPSTTTTPTWYTQTPNALHPPFDFLRQEFGPFVRGCTLADMKDLRLAKAWTRTPTADPAPFAGLAPRVFYDVVDYLTTPQGIQEFGHRVYLRQDNVHEWTTYNQIQTRQPWRAVASSLDGDRFIAVAATGVLLYHNGQWQSPPNPPQKPWTCVASSGTGQRLLMAAHADQVYQSQNYGHTWDTVSSLTAEWTGLATTTDGALGLAVANDGQLYKYQAPGGHLATPTYFDPAQQYNVFVDAAANADGTLVVAITDESIFVTQDQGVTWKIQQLPYNMSEGWWVAVAIGKDDRLYIVSDLGSVVQGTVAYVQVEIEDTCGNAVQSTELNINWTFVESKSPSFGWSTILAYNNGNLKAVTDYGRIFTYTYTGPTTGTWNSGEYLFGITVDNVDLASNANATRLVACVKGGAVYLFTTDNEWQVQTHRPHPPTPVNGQPLPCPRTLATMLPSSATANTCGCMPGPKTRTHGPPKNHSVVSHGPPSPSPPMASTCSPPSRADTCTRRTISETPGPATTPHRPSRGSVSSSTILPTTPKLSAARPSPTPATSTLTTSRSTPIPPAASCPKSPATSNGETSPCPTTDGLGWRSSKMDPFTDPPTMARHGHRRPPSRTAWSRGRAPPCPQMERPTWPWRPTAPSPCGPVQVPRPRSFPG